MSEVAAACDFQASFMTWDRPRAANPPPGDRGCDPLGNKARIQLDALLDVVHEDTGVSERFVLIAPCRSEWMYVPDRIFKLPSEEYRCIYSRAEERRIGRAITFQGEGGRTRPLEGNFRSFAIDVRTFARSRALTTSAAICEATQRNVPLVGRTTIRDPQRPRRYVLEYPIRTMNIRPEVPAFQVDTGPLLVPDFTSTQTNPIDRLELAHVAYNRLDWAEFILRRPTAITADGKELCKVLHFSEVRDYSADNQVLTSE
jgi:hypothetical protein